MPEVIFNGPDGRLEGRYHHGGASNAPVVLLLHPQPQNGGTMNNKVVYALYHAFVRRGFSTLRFNFRGVGRSQGKFDNGPGELSDAAAALDWLQTINPNAGSCWVGGFSFGAWVGMQLLMRRPEIDGFISIAPPANLYDFSFLAPCPSSGLVVHGSNDRYVPRAAVQKLTAKLSTQKNITIQFSSIENADHSFAGKLDELTTILDSYLADVPLMRQTVPPRSSGNDDDEADLVIDGADDDDLELGED